MPTHQSLSGSSDEDLLRRMVETHPERYGPDFWAFFTARVAASLPPRPVMIDLGCGPGLLLRDLAERHPGSTLHGYDVNGEPLQCRATTRKGSPCKRMPLAHNGYCQSHQHLAETEDVEAMPLAA